MLEQTPGPTLGQRSRPGTEEDGVEIRRRSELLRHLGFQQSQVVDPDTGRPAWMWVRLWRGVREAVVANGDGALAYQVWDVDFDPDKPFLIEKDITIWSTNGSFLDVSAQLLTQGAPTEHSHFPSRERRRTADHHPSPAA